MQSVVTTYRYLVAPRSRALIYRRVVIRLAARILRSGSHPGSGDEQGSTVAEERKRIRRKPEHAEREILDTAEEFLRDDDFRELTVDEVMAPTGMVRSAF